MNVIAQSHEKRYGKGTSKSAWRRRRENACKLHQPKPGQTIQMSRDASYFVAKDGSLRRITLLPITKIEKAA